MKFRIHIDGAEHQVEAGADGTLSFGGETFQAKVGRPADDRLMVQIGDKSYEVRIVNDGAGNGVGNGAETGVLVLEIAGERIPVTVTDVSRRAPAAGLGAAPVAGAAADGNQAETIAPEDIKEGVWAPVPGKIVDVLVKPGDAVEEGALLLILEAMKMENELHAPKKGIVKAVLVNKGDQAEKGQLLVALE